MTRLHAFRKRLSSLRRRRSLVRLETAYSALFLAVLWILAVAFLVDWWLEMSRIQRLVCWVSGAAITAWAFYRYALPWLGARETELDIALLVERTEHIDSDLVAAVQFESPEAPEWGSVQLEQAVIDQVAKRGERMDVMHGLSRRELSQRVILLAVTLVFWAGIIWWAPGHVAMFFRRLALSAQRYPTKTVIDTVVVKTAKADRDDADAAVDWTAIEAWQGDNAGATATQYKVLHGRRVRFEVQCSGVIPEKGTVEMLVGGGDLARTLELERVGDSDVFAGELERIRQSHRYQIYLGDAWTDPAELSVTTLPRVAIELEVAPPPYAVAGAGVQPSKTAPGLRLVRALEGSRVRIRLTSDKPLRTATVTMTQKLAEADAVRAHEMTPDESDSDDEPGKHWVLNTPGTWLSPVLGRVEFELDVTDVDGQHLERPIGGIVRIKPDDPPTLVDWGIVTPEVRATAVPAVTFHARDDYGVARVSLLCEVIRADKLPQREEVPVYALSGDELSSRKTELDDRFILDLKKMIPVALEKGDQVKVTPKVVDYRGRREGESTLGDPIELKVTDIHGILHGIIREGDRRSVFQLDTMIERELGTGGSP